jgi:hypothetical protein
LTFDLPISPKPVRKREPRNEAAAGQAPPAPWAPSKPASAPLELVLEFEFIGGWGLGFGVAGPVRPALKGRRPALKRRRIQIS